MRHLLVHVGIAALAAGCGGGSGDDAPAEPDAGEDAACQMPPGPTYLLTSFGIAPLEDAFDLDGDGTGDNQLGNLPAATIDVINDGYRDSIDAGEWMIATLMDDWTDPPTASDPSTGLHVLQLTDADSPDDVSNDRTGGAFYASSSFLDLDCHSTTRAAGAIEDGVFVGERELLEFPLNTGTGSLDMVDMIVEVTYAADYKTAVGRVGSYVTLCTFSGVPLALPDTTTSSSSLDYMVNDPQIVENAPVDGDLDGDGLEQVIGDGVGVLHCIDGDGTIIEGSDCPCYPEIADAYSTTIAFELLEVPVLGVR